MIFGQRVLIFTQSRVVLENRIDDFELGVLVVAQVTLSGCDGTARGREGLVAVKERVGDHNVAFRADEECAAAVGVTDDRITDELRVRDVGNLQDRHCATGIGLIFRECRVFDIQNIVGARCRQELRNGAALAGSILRECRVFNIDRAAIEDECAALRPVDGIAIGGLRNESGRVVVKNAVADVENVIGIGGIESHHRAFVFTRLRPNDVFVRLVDKVGTFIVRCASKSRTVDAGESGNHGKANHFLRIHFVSPLQTECLPYSKLSLVEAHPVNLHQNGTASLSKRV